MGKRIEAIIAGTSAPSVVAHAWGVRGKSAREQQGWPEEPDKLLLGARRRASVGGAIPAAPAEGPTPTGAQGRPSGRGHPVRNSRLHGPRSRRVRGTMTLASRPAATTPSAGMHIAASEYRRGLSFAAGPFPGGLMREAGGTASARRVAALTAAVTPPAVAARSGRVHREANLGPDRGSPYRNSMAFAGWCGGVTHDELSDALDAAMAAQRREFVQDHRLGVVR